MSVSFGFGTVGGEIGIQLVFVSQLFGAGFSFSWL